MANRKPAVGLHSLRTWLTPLACAVGLVTGSAGCSSDDGATASGPSIDRATQDPLAIGCDAASAGCWDAELAKLPDLQTMVGTIAKPVQAAGTLTDKAGNRLIWAELAATADAPRTEVSVAFARCSAKNLCKVGRADYTASGATFVDASGAPFGDVTIGRPILRKKLKAHAPDKDPTLLAPLETSAKPDAELAWATWSGMQFKKRRCVVLNAYGPEVGLSAAPIAQACSTSGRFDSTEVIDYARVSDMAAILPTLTPLDALFWVGAGVYEERTEGERRHGMTLSRGVFGDQLVYGKGSPDLIKGLPLGGPGLVVLAGADTMAANSWTDINTLANVLHDVPARAMVGFTAKTGGTALVAAAGQLGKSLFGGAALSTALAGAGAPVVSDLAPDTLSKWKWAAPNASFWGGKNPTKAAIKMYVRLEPPICTHVADACTRSTFNAAYKTDQVPATEMNGGNSTYICDLQFDGPFFSCDVDNPDAGQKFMIRGLMRGHAEGDRFWVLALGTGLTLYKDLLVLGEGVLGKSDHGGGSSSVQFSGDAVVGTWTDPDGRCCTTKGAAALTNYNSEPSLLQTWP